MLTKIVHIPSGYITELGKTISVKERTPQAIIKEIIKNADSPNGFSVECKWLLKCAGFMDTVVLLDLNNKDELVTFNPPLNYIEFELL